MVVYDNTEAIEHSKRKQMKNQVNQYKTVYSSSDTEEEDGIDKYEKQKPWAWNQDLLDKM